MAKLQVEIIFLSATYIQFQRAFLPLQFMTAMHIVESTCTVSGVPCKDCEGLAPHFDLPTILRPLQSRMGKGKANERSSLRRQESNMAVGNGSPNPHLKCKDMQSDLCIWQPAPWPQGTRDIGEIETGMSLAVSSLMGQNGQNPGARKRYPKTAEWIVIPPNLVINRF